VIGGFSHLADLEGVGEVPRGLSSGRELYCRITDEIEVLLADGVEGGMEGGGHFFHEKDSDLRREELVEAAVKTGERERVGSEKIDDLPFGVYACIGAAGGLQGNRVL
jgi:hypothetical protein